ncbi:hypothetical protein V1517DRAFT_331620 [Lipomyces orientalis]|uniref:Uncharacterized protein n=1 Tax=Lipomyces orientalis TaxID=1233043 RepID=A0ACC3TFR2_9ASCO
MTNIPGQYDSPYQVPGAIVETQLEQQQTDDHSLSYQSVQQIHVAFSSFWTNYAEKFIQYSAAVSHVDRGVGCIAELHQRYVDTYLAGIEFNNLTETSPDGPGGLREEPSEEAAEPRNNNEIPDFSPEPADLELDERLSKVEQQIKRLDKAENSPKPPIKKRGRQVRKWFTEPAAKRSQLKATRGDRRGAGGIPRKPRLQARRGILSCEVIVNRYSPRAHPYQTGSRKSFSGPFGMSKKRRKGKNKIDLDELWAAHWRLARPQIVREIQPSQRRRPLPFLHRALEKGKKFYVK